MSELRPELKGRLAEAERALNSWRQEVASKAPPFDPAQDLRIAIELYRQAEKETPNDPRPATYRLLVDLADVYLTSGVPLQRAIRDGIHGTSTVVDELMPCIGWCAEQLQVERSPIWLRRGLALAAISEARPDFRDLYGWLWDLHQAARGAAIDPLPEFVSVGMMSFDESTRKQLTEFEDSAFFASMGGRRSSLRIDPRTR
jgi:hypothetical protein